MTTTRRRLAAVAVTAGLAAAPGSQALAAPTTAARADAAKAVAAAQAKRTPAAISARSFIVKATRSNLFEITTGQLAQQRARSAGVKELGAMFVADHTKLNAQGAAVAKALGITPPTTLSPAQQKLVTQLQALSGRKFDRAWIAAQLLAHAQALQLTLRGTISGKRPEIRTLAAGALPIVATHLGELQDLAR
jgi:putative membrane protein